MTIDKTIRVSCSGLVSIEVGEKQLGVYSRSKLKKNPPQWFMTPWGGKYHYDQQTQVFLESLDATFENLEKKELAVAMPERNVQTFTEWFYSREGREVNPARELYEELIEEEGILPDENIPYILRGDFVLQKRTEKAGGGEQTLYFLEIFRAELGKDKDEMNALWEAADKDSARLRLITPSEILKGSMYRLGSPEHGAEVGDAFQFMQHSGRKLEDYVATHFQHTHSVYHLDNVAYSGEQLSPHK